MRYTFLSFLLFLALLSHSQRKVFDENILIAESEKILNNASLRIYNPEEADCDYDLGEYWIKHYLDSDGRLVKTVKKHNFAADAILASPIVEIYDLKGNLVLRKKQGYDGEIYNLTLFKYNSFNLLAEEFHLDTFYIYRIFHKNNSNYRKNKKLYYTSKGKRVSSWKRAKRKDLKKD